MKIAVLTSGGVDSSVALKLLKDQGHDLTAFYLKIWLEDELSFLGNCPWEEDLKFIREICAKEKIHLKILPLQKEYWHEVVKYTISELKAGRTPNPDILCNQKIKFGRFYEKIDRSYEKIATGHYAQVEKRRGKFLLKRSPDKIKDQTYFLSHLDQKQLARAIFPIGHLQKKEVRGLAEKYNLPNQNRKDSQGICFLGKFAFHDFVRAHLGVKKGDIIDFDTGKKIAEHEGFWYYTVGQRKGIGLSGGPWFVVKKDIKKNRIFVSKNYHEENKPRDSFIVEKVNWIAEHPPKKIISNSAPACRASAAERNSTGKAAPITVKLRHGPSEYFCKIKKISPHPKNRTPSWQVKITGQDQGIAPGQFAVFYQGDYCLGSGTMSIEKAKKSKYLIKK